MTLAFHNTLTRRKEAFRPLDPALVRMYVCGPTVYDYAHIGNARPVVVFDVLYRLLRHLYPRVVYVRNITDIDDKINARAAETGRTIREITEVTAEAFRADMAALGALPPDREPRATEHVAGMVEMIGTLLARGHAYEAEGHVLFDVPSMPDYGRLSRRNRAEQIDGARVEVAPYKRDPADFVLWKPSAGGEPGWDSPWGFGRPGWHIECSAMSRKYLGETFDIHAGGIDLVFPHHENEIAQSRCAHGTAAMASVWMHNGFVTVEGEKMAKSAGNFRTVRELLEQGWPGEAIRYALLAAHYRAPLDHSRRGLAEARAALDRLHGALRRAGAGGGAEPAEEAGARRAAPSPATVAALSDDLNTPLALSRLHELASAANKAGDAGERAARAAELRASAGLVGLLQGDPHEWFQQAPVVELSMRAEAGKPAVGITPSAIEPAEIERLIAERAAARKARDFAEADRIRDDLGARGVLLEDGPDGTTWRRA